MPSSKVEKTKHRLLARGGDWLVGIDIGGTFTDLTLWREGKGTLYAEKVLSTPEDPSLGALKGFRSLLAKGGVSPDQVRAVIHATTVATNAVIERKGPLTGLITTKGFRDVLELGTGLRYDIYDLYIAFPEPLVPRALRYEVDGRIDPSGKTVAPFAEDEVDAAAHKLKRAGVKSIAVSFLHSYANPEHERKAAQIVSKAAPGISVSLSSQVSAEAREFERTVTTVIDAYVKPLVEKYLDRLAGGLGKEGFRGELFVMLSHGGIARAAEAAKVFPVRIIESGPAAGVLAAGALGRLIGRPDLLSFDMGGTTAKLCLIQNGEPAVAREFEVARVRRFKRGSGFPLRIPAIELIEIGAGGGSIARLDDLGLLKVGPDSSGANPGPACYSQGGTLPTVTDANLVLGYLNPNYFLGGDMALDENASRRAINEHCAVPLKVTLEEAAAGICDLVSENMADAARVHIAEQGEDPRRFSLMAFGGAGPLHAYSVAAKLGIRELICPAGAGVISSLGQLTAPMAFDLVRTHYGLVDDLDWKRFRKSQADLSKEAKSYLKLAGVPEKKIVLAYSADIRYVGQGYEIRVPLPDGALSAKSIPAIRRAFWREYQKLYGRSVDNVTLEMVNLRLSARGPRPSLRLRWQHTNGAHGEGKAGLIGKRRIYLREAGGYCNADVYSRYSLATAREYHGPALVEERESTTLIGKSGKFSLDSHRNLVIRLKS